MEDNKPEEQPPLEVVSEGTLEQITRGEIDMQISTAKRYPRSISKFKAKALEMATLDEETAESCFYNLPREGKEIKGPSARLAEIVASAWTNTRSGARVISQDGKTITAQAFMHDLETNTHIAMEVKRKITNKKGQTYSEDMIVVTGNAACAIAHRNAVFKVIPMAYVRSIYEAARKVAIGDATTLAGRRQKFMDRFGKMGIVPGRVLAVLGKGTIEDITLDDLETLAGLGTAIKAGDTTVDEAFPKEEPKVDLTKKRTSEKNDEASKADPAATAATASGPASTAPVVTTANVTDPPAPASPPADKPKPKPKADKPAVPAPATEQAKIQLPAPATTPPTELALLQAEMARLVITEQPLIDLAKRVEDEGIRIAATVTSLSQLPDDELKTLRVNLSLLAMLLTGKGQG